MLPSVTFSPIGVVHAPFDERASAPRQPDGDAIGTIELFNERGLEHAVADLDAWQHIWVIFWFHRNAGWRPKVLPPRSKTRRGVLATRSPHRPNAIGLSVVKLDRIVGLTLHVRNLDMLDGTPVLDVKPYLPYADALSDAGTGWLENADPVAPFEVVWSEQAEAQRRWLQDSHGIALHEPVERTLALGPAPHPYRRIKLDAKGMVLAVKDWRVRFRVDGRAITVESIATGYRARDLATSPDPAVVPHRAYVAVFGGRE